MWSIFAAIYCYPGAWCAGRDLKMNPSRSPGCVCRLFCMIDLPYQPFHRLLRPCLICQLRSFFNSTSIVIIITELHYAVFSRSWCQRLPLLFFLIFPFFSFLVVSFPTLLNLFFCRSFWSIFQSKNLESQQVSVSSPFFPNIRFCACSSYRHIQATTIGKLGFPFAQTTEPRRVGKPTILLCRLRMGNISCFLYCNIVSLIFFIVQKPRFRTDADIFLIN